MTQHEIYSTLQKCNTAHIQQTTVGPQWAESDYLKARDRGYQVDYHPNGVVSTLAYWVKSSARLYILEQDDKGVILRFQSLWEVLNEYGAVDHINHGLFLTRLGGNQITVYSYGTVKENPPKEITESDMEELKIIKNLAEKIAGGSYPAEPFTPFAISIKAEEEEKKETQAQLKRREKEEEKARIKEAEAAMRIEQIERLAQKARMQNRQNQLI